MRIGIDIRAFRGPFTGVANYQFHLLQALLQRTDEFCFRAFDIASWRALDGRFLSDLHDTLKRSPSVAKAATARARPTLWSAVTPMLRSLPSGAASLLRTLAFQLTVKQQDLDLFHSFNYLPPAPTAAPTVPVVYDLSFIRYPSTHPQRRLRWLKPLDSQIREAPIVHTISQFTAGEIEEHYNVPRRMLRVIYPGVADIYRAGPVCPETTLASYGLAPFEYVLVVSTLEPRKNLKTLVEAYSRLPSNVRRKLPLCVVGSPGWGDTMLATRFGDLLHDGTVRLLGYVPDWQLCDLYSFTRGFFYPSIYEGFGMPIIEAAACGAPTVVSNAAAMPEAASPQSILVDPLNVDDWLSALRRTADEDWARTPDHRGAQQAFAAKYTWSASADALLSLYRNLHEPGTLR